MHSSTETASSSAVVDQILPERSVTVTQKLWIQKPELYRGVAVDNLKVSEVGRYNDLEEPMTVWSVQSGDQIPARCKIPELDLPTQLPLSLRTTDTSGGQPMEMSAVDRVLRWAEAVGYSLKDIDIVAGRSVMKQLCLTPYYNLGERSKWSMKLYRYKNTVCLEIDDWHRPAWYGPPSGPPTDETAAWAKVFEDMMRTNGRGTPGYACEDVDIRMPRLVELGSLKILSNGRICCQTSGKYQDVLDNCVEMKVREKFDPSRKNTLASYKANRRRDIWAQCAPMGIQTVYIGKRTSGGDLTEIEEFTMDKLARNCSRFWQPETMLTFLNMLLTWLKTSTRNGMTYTLANQGKGYLILDAAEHEDLVRIVRASFPEV